MLGGIFISFVSRFASGALAFTMPKLHWISLPQTKIMPAIRAKIGYGYVVGPIKIQV